MFFVDNSGHIFELTDYTKKPIGYQFDETPYVFWLSDNNENSRLSINNYYAKSINLLFPIDNVSNFNTQNISDILNIEIEIDSKIFSLIPSNKFQEALSSSASILDYISSFDDYDVCEEYLKTLNKDQLIEFGNNYNITFNENLTENQIIDVILNKLIFTKQILSSDNDDDLLVIKVTQNEKNYIMIPIYVIGNTAEEGTWSSNILLHISYKYTDKHIWCPFSVGGTFVDEYESLIIHGQNMGVSLPKDIIKAINGTSFFNDDFNVEIYNKKLKEYMLNYMSIHGECGNYNSAITALNWFGYGDLISLYKLIETTNEFKHQYIRDYFNVNNDLLIFFKEFINTQYVSVLLKLNNEIGELDKQDVDVTKMFWGEGTPLMKDLYNETELIYTKEYFANQKYAYVDKYFKYSLNELLLKLSCLAYYYDKYFLPLYIKLNNVHAQYKVYANDVKLHSYATDIFIEPIINTCDWDNDVTFDEYNIRFLTNQYHYVDENFNEFYINGLGDDGDYRNHHEDWYLINDSCINVPIHFKYYEDQPYKNYYDCMIFLKDDRSTEPLFTSKFSFFQTENYKYNSFVIYPKLFEKKFNIKQSYINKSFTLYVYANGSYYEYHFTIKAPEFDVNIGKLEYKYWANDINYLNTEYKKQLNNGNDNAEIHIEFFDKDNEESPTVLNITEYIKNYDFFDEPTKYMSPFVQIDEITNDKVKFNTFMHEPAFVSINDLNLGLDLSPNKTLNDLIANYQSNVNISNNYKFLNNVHLYELYKIEEQSQENFTKEHDILKFYKDIMVRVNDIIIYKSKLDNKFTILGQHQGDIINTKDNVDYYVLNNKPEIIENNAWYYILERKIENTSEGKRYNITGQNANSLYSTYLDKTNKKSIGYLIFDNAEDARKNQNVLYNGLTVDYDKITLEGNKLIYIYKNHNYTLFYKNSFVKLVNGHYEEFSPTNIDFHYNYSSIFIKLDLYYYEETSVLNIFGYYNSLSQNNITCTDINIVRDENDNIVDVTCTVTIKDPVNEDDSITINNVLLHPSKYYEYNALDDNEESIGLTFNQNASAVWTTLDENDYFNVNDVINEINLEYYTLDNISEINNEESGTKYINYLVSDLTGLSGSYHIKCESENENIKVKVLIEKETGNELYTNNENPDFSLTGDEKQVILYFEIGENTEDAVFTPHLYKYEVKEIPIKYTGNDPNFYKEFFYKKYSLKAVNLNNEEDKVIKDIWDAKLKYNDYYDTYLMHGYKDSMSIANEQEQTWYFVFISKDTCDKFENTSMLDKYLDAIEYSCGNNKYVLRHVISKKLFLINRMKFIESKGVNHFSKDDLIVCSLENNSMLPTNFELHSKWEIHPLSFGVDSSIKILGNGNMSILSIPKNDNAYNKGYYEIMVNYSLNRSFINNQVIKKKILIEK